MVGTNEIRNKICWTDSFPTVEKLLKHVQPKVEESEKKVTVVGCGQVGMATVISLLTQNVTNHIAMVDVNKKLIGEMLDLKHGSSFISNAKIDASKEYDITAGSKLCIVNAGVAQQEGETRLALLQRNTDVLKEIIPQLVKYSPGTIIIISTNPVDVLSYVAWKLSGLPQHRIIGSGTNLDTSRFQYLLSEQLGIAPTSCHGHIIGEHGDSSVPVWSEVNIAGVRLRDLNPNIGEDGDKENWKEIHKHVVNSAYEIIKLKGYTSWAIGLSLTQLANAILFNTKTVHAVSTCLKGFHGIEDEVFLSLPCVLGLDGIKDVVRQDLTEKEVDQLRKSAAVVAKVQSEVKLDTKSEALSKKEKPLSGEEDTRPTVEKLLKRIQSNCSEDTGHKVSVIGCGNIGMATVISLLTQKVTNHIAMVDNNEDKLSGELMDLQHGSSFMGNPKIEASTDVAISAHSKICIVTAGAHQKAGESTVEIVQRQTEVFKKFIPKLVKYSPEAVLLIATDPPVDILTYVAWKLSELPHHRVIGSGTNLDSIRFRYLLSEKLGVAPISCYGFIIGEHGERGIPVWSGVNVAGVRLIDVNQKMGKQDDKENWKSIHEHVVTSTFEINKLKGYTSWAYGLSLSHLANSILSNNCSVDAVSTYLKGLHGIEDEVFLSLPCVLGHGGITDVVKQGLSVSEVDQLRKSAGLVAGIQKQIKFTS